jgi:HK97 family phage major capsid protein
MNPRVKELRQQRAAIVQEMHDLTEKTSFTAEAQARWSTLDEQQKGLEAQIKTLERQDQLNREMRTVQNPPHIQPGAASPEDPAARNTTETATDTAARRANEVRGSTEYRNEFLSWVRTGRASTRFDAMQAEVRTYNAMNTTDGPSGEYTIPIGFQRELEKIMKAYGGMRRNARVVPTSTGNPLHWPTVDDTSNIGQFLTENAPVSQVNPVFGEVIYSAWLASSLQVLVSVQLMQDSAFDLEALLAELLGIRLGRIVENKYTVGAKSAGTPIGIVTSILGDATPNVVTAVGSTANDGIAGNTGANSIGSDDLDNLISAVDPAYRGAPTNTPPADGEGLDGQEAIFMGHWSILDYLRKVKDKYGRPLWVVSIADGVPDRIYGYRYDWNAAMDAAVAGVPAAGKNSLIFGNFSRYIVRDVLGVTMVRYNELYMPNHQVGFQAYLRTDGQRLVQPAFALLQQHT